MKITQIHLGEKAQLDDGLWLEFRFTNPVQASSAPDRISVTLSSDQHREERVLDVGVWVHWKDHLLLLAQVTDKPHLAIVEVSRCVPIEARKVALGSDFTLAMGETAVAGEVSIAPLTLGAWTAELMLRNADEWETLDLGAHGCGRWNDLVFHRRPSPDPRQLMLRVEAPRPAMQLQYGRVFELPLDANAVGPDQFSVEVRQVRDASCVDLELRRGLTYRRRSLRAKEEDTLLVVEKYTVALEELRPTSLTLRVDKLPSPSFTYGNPFALEQGSPQVAPDGVVVIFNGGTDVHWTDPAGRPQTTGTLSFSVVDAEREHTLDIPGDAIGAMRVGPVSIQQVDREQARLRVIVSRPSGAGPQVADRVKQR